MRETRPPSRRPAPVVSIAGMLAVALGLVGCFSDAPPPAVKGEDASGTADVGEQDAGSNTDAPVDSGTGDAGSDLGAADLGPTDTGQHDTPAVDDTSPPLDAGCGELCADAGSADTGALDAGSTDLGDPDAGPVDTGVDAGMVADVPVDRGGPETSVTVRRSSAIELVAGAATMSSARYRLVVQLRYGAPNGGVMSAATRVLHGGVAPGR